MAKKPPGAKKRGPTERRRPNEWSNDAKAVMHRMMNAKPLVGCHPDKADEVLWEIREFINGGTWEPELENFSLFHGEDSRGFGLIQSYGLPDEVRSLVVWHLEKHDKYDDWRVWDATEI